jgi:hypothetical protein
MNTFVFLQSGSKQSREGISDSFPEKRRGLSRRSLKAHGQDIFTTSIPKMKDSDVAITCVVYDLPAPQTDQERKETLNEQYRNYERETYLFLMASKASNPMLNCSKHSSSGIAQVLISYSSKTCMLTSFLPQLLQSENKNFFPLFFIFSIPLQPL